MDTFRIVVDHAIRFVVDAFTRRIASIEIYFGVKPEAGFSFYFVIAITRGTNHDYRMNQAGRTITLE